MWARFRGTINLSSPTRALPVAIIRFSPLAVNGSSVVPVCLPFNDHSVSPCLTTKTRGVVILSVIPISIIKKSFTELIELCFELVQRFTPRSDAHSKFYNKHNVRSIGMDLDVRSNKQQFSKYYK